MKKFSWQAVDFALLIRGFIALNIQILLIREFLIIFNGNELTIGIILANWLILEAIGSGLIGKLADRTKQYLSCYIWLQVIIALSMPLSIWFLRLSRQIFHITAGEVISVVPMFLSCLFVFFPIAIVDGAQFAFGCKLYSSIKKSEATSIGKVYILEAMGMITGGVIFTYIFIRFFNSFQVAFLLGSLSIVSAIFIDFTLRPDTRKNFASRIILVAVLALNLFMLLTGKINALQNSSISRQWNKENVVAYQNSIYGNTTVIKKQNQYTFFSNGVPVITTPVPDIASIEDFVHFPLLIHPSPKKVLVISAAAGGILNEILKYPVTKIDYAELDPLLIELVNKFPTELTFKELMDKRVHIKFQDGRQFVKNTKEKYDVILINLDLPSSLQLNRFYTKEFFQEAKKKLNEQGIFVIKCWGSMVYIGKEQKNINASFLATLEKTFQNVRVIPGETNIYIASKKLALDKIRALDIQNWKKLYKIQASLLTNSYISYRFDPYWQKWFLDSIKNPKMNLINQDFTPRGLFFSLDLLYSLISPQTKHFFNAAEKINLSIVLTAIFLFSIIFLMLKKIKGVKNVPLPLFLGITGFSGITFQLVIILGFQIVFGFLYYWLGMLTSAFMLGLTAGSVLINKNLDKIKNELTVFFEFEAILFFFALILPLILNLISVFYYIEVSRLILQGIFFASSILAGFLVGLEFPLANKIYWKNKEMISHTAGALYACDLIGACAGGILVPIVFIPILGIAKTCLVVASLKLSSLIIIKTFK